MVDIPLKKTTEASANSYKPFGLTCGDKKEKMLKNLKKNPKKPQKTLRYEQKCYERYSKNQTCHEEMSKIYLLRNTR